MKGFKELIFDLNKLGNTAFEEKELYVEGGKVINWVMKIDVDFNEWSVKFAELYQSNNHKYYKIKITHKENLAIKIDNDIKNILVKE